MDYLNLLWDYLNQSNHHIMHRKVKILNMMFLLLITDNQFKVVFKVYFLVHYQFGHNYKADASKRIKLGTLVMVQKILMKCFIKVLKCS